MWPRRVTNSMSAWRAGLRAGRTLTTQVARATRVPHPAVTACRRPGTPRTACSGPAKRTGVRAKLRIVSPLPARKATRPCRLLAGRWLAPGRADEARFARRPRCTARDPGARPDRGRELALRLPLGVVSGPDRC